MRQTLKPLPYVAAAVVDRDFPDTLRVRVIEYRPAAYLLSAGRWFVVADDGHVILQLGQGASGSPADSGAGTATADASGPSPDASTAASPESSGSAGSASGVATATPASAGPDPAKLAAGPPRAPFHLPSIWTDVVVREGQTLRDAKVCAALGVALALPPARREQVRAIRVSATTGLTLTMTEGLRSCGASADRSLAKTLALGAVLARYRLDGQRPTFVDVSVPDRRPCQPRPQVTVETAFEQRSRAPERDPSALPIDTSGGRQYVNPTGWERLLSASPGPRESPAKHPYLGLLSSGRRSTVE